MKIVGATEHAVVLCQISYQILDPESVVTTASMLSMIMRVSVIANSINSGGVVGVEMSVTTLWRKNDDDF